MRIIETAPLNGGAGWAGVAHNTGMTTHTVFVWAICAHVSP
jgi:hypothetical protein